MRALDHPTPRSVTGDLLPLGCLLAARLDVGGVTPVAQQLSHVWVVIPLVRTQVLSVPPRGSRPLDASALRGLLNESLVARVGAADRYTQGDAGAIGRQGALGPRLGPTGGIRPGSPHNGALPIAPSRYYHAQGFPFEKPGERVMLIVPSATPREIAFRYPTRGAKSTPTNPPGSPKAVLGGRGHADAANLRKGIGFPVHQ